MPTEILAQNSTFTVANSNTTVFGNTGIEIVKLLNNQLTGIQIDPNVERVEFTSNLADYQFQIVGNLASIHIDGHQLVTLTLGQNTQLAFADGSEDLSISELNKASLGSVDLPVTPQTISGVNLDSNDKSSIAVVAEETVFSLSPHQKDINEGDDNTTELGILTVSRTGDLNTTAQVNLTASSLDATAGVDYQDISQIITFALGQATVSVPYNFQGDKVFEGNETVVFALSNPSVTDVSGAIISSRLDTNADKATFTIIDDDIQSEPTFNFTLLNNTLIEGNAGTSRIAVVITRDDASQAATVDLISNDINSAQFGVDYSIAGAISSNANNVLQVPFAINETAKTVHIDIIGDTDIETDENFILFLANASIGQIDPSSSIPQTITISNDDSAPTIFSIDLHPNNIDEGGFITLTISRSNSIGSATVDVQTVSNTAIASSDFESLFQTIFFTEGEINKTIDIQTLTDTEFDPNKSFGVILSNPSNGGVLDPIQNAVSIAINEVGKMYGSSGYDTVLVPDNAGFLIDSTVEKVIFNQNLDQYNFSLNGNILSVNLANIGSAAQISANLDNIELSFADGSAIFQLTGLGTGTFNGDHLSSDPSNPSTFSWISSSSRTVDIATNGIDDSGFDSVENVSNIDAQFTFNQGNYEYIINGFGIGDQLNVNGSSIVVKNTAVDGLIDIDIADSASGSVVQIHLVGVDPALDGQVFSQPTFNSTFGENSLISLQTTFSITSPNFLMTEEGGGFHIEISRDNTIGTASVQVATQAGTATDSLDYISLAQTVVFLEGESTKEVYIQTIDDTLQEDSELFRVNLFNPIASEPNALAHGDITVVINDNDVTSVGLSSKHIVVNSTGIDDSGFDSFEDVRNIDAQFTFIQGTYEYIINGFGIGDQLNVLNSSSITVINAAVDGNIDLQISDSTSGSSIQLHLIGIDPALDGQVFSQPTFLSTFGLDSLG